MRKVFLDDLPRYKDGNNKGNINWLSVKGYKINFIYNNNNGYIKIIDVFMKNGSSRVVIKYKDKTHELSTQNLAKAQLGKLFVIHKKSENKKEVKKYTKEFKIEIGTIFKDDKRDIIITDRKYMKDKWNHTLKYYKYNCNKCGFDCSEHWRNEQLQKDYWVLERDLLKENGVGCLCCAGQAVVENINSIVATADWMIPYFQGGYNEAKKFTHGSKYKVYPICQDCGRVKDKSIPVKFIYKNHSVGCCCSDSTSYNEKAMFALLEQLRIDFQTQLNKTRLKWCDKYYYDFYFELNNEQYIIETHGEQHYKRGFFSSTNGKKVKTLEEQQEVDNLKKELALSNGIKPENYIIIDCRESNLDWIRDNENGILNSRLNELFDLSKIDWLKCEEFALSNRVKEVCELWESGMTNKEISKTTKISRCTIGIYLNRGKNFGWCNYTPSNKKGIGNRNRKPRKEIREFNKKPIIVLNTKNIFLSAMDLMNKSEKLFGTKLLNTKIGEVCLGKYPQYKGYTFKYIKDLTTEEYIKYDIKNKLKEVYKDMNIKYNIICITTKDKFYTIQQAIDYFNMNERTSGIGKCCKGQQHYCGKLEDGTPLEWMYYEDYIKQQSIHNKDLRQVV